jgi:hypothetical protein
MPILRPDTQSGGQPQLVASRAFGNEAEIIFLDGRGRFRVRCSLRFVS